MAPRTLGGTFRQRKVSLTRSLGRDDPLRYVKTEQDLGKKIDHKCSVPTLMKD